jgi:hypothetical protein
MNQAKRDCILRSDFNPLTRQGIVQFLEDHDGHDERMLGPVESWAFLWFQLRAAEDNPKWFPSGKWATLQHLESLLIECLP